MNSTENRLNSYLESVFLWDVKGETAMLMFFVAFDEAKGVLKYLKEHGYNVSTDGYDNMFSSALICVKRKA